jgi:hypothetical protein
MTDITRTTWRGEVPAAETSKIPDGYARTATNAKLGSGALEAYFDLSSQGQMAKAASGEIRTLYAMDIAGVNGGPYYLHWHAGELGAGAVKVDVTRGLIPGDTHDVTYFTGTDAPRVTNRTLATTGGSGGAMPYASRLLGVPAPTTAPTVVVQAGEVSGDVELDNPGAEDGVLFWTTTSGSLTSIDQTTVPGLVPFAGAKYFSYGSAATSDVKQNRNAGADAVIAGQVLTIKWQQARGANSSKAALGVRFYDDTDTLISESIADLIAAAGLLTWGERTLAVVVPTAVDNYDIVQLAEQVGGGTCDAYIDAITIDLDLPALSFDGSSLDGWETSTNGGTSEIVVDDVSGVGWPVPAFRLSSRANGVASMRRNLSMSRTPSGLITFQGQNNGVGQGVVFGASASGSGACIAFEEDGVWLRNFTSWASVGARISQIETGNHKDAAFSASLSFTANGNGRATVEFTTRRQDDNTVIATGSIDIDLLGDFLGFVGFNSSDWRNSWWDNIAISLAAPVAEDDSEEVGTAYVVYFRNGSGQLSAPSPPSQTIIKSEGSKAVVTTTTTAPADYDIVDKVIARATGRNGDFLFVDAIPLAQADYEDSKSDEDLGEIMEPDEDWLPPPSNMRGIIAAANGFLGGHFENQYCVCVKYRSQAWPSGWRLTTEFDIVASTATETDIIVTTQANCYIAIGSDPATLDFPKLGGAFGNVSEASLVAIGNSAIYASANGLVGVSRGGARLISEAIISRTFWQSLKPSSIWAVTHDGLYFGFFDTGTVQGGFIFDPSDTESNGFVPLDFYATAGYSNPITDRLELVVGGARCIWDAAAGKLAYDYETPDALVSRPTSFEFARVVAKDYAALTLKLYYDDVLIFTKAITSSREFLLPDKEAEQRVRFQLQGTSTVELVSIAESIEELK